MFKNYREKNQSLEENTCIVGEKIIFLGEKIVFGWTKSNKSKRQKVELIYISKKYMGEKKGFDGPHEQKNQGLSLQQASAVSNGHGVSLV